MSRATRLSAILFDIGGVLITLDGVPSLAKLLGVEPSHEALHRLWMTSASVVAHETGRISATEFAAGVVVDLGLPVSAAAFLEDFCCWPGGLQPGAMELLDAIPPTYRVAALSNTSALHWDKIVATGLTRRFQRAFLSYEIGHLKPSREAFLAALEGLDLPANEVLFIGDGESNVHAAASLGMHARLARNAVEARSALAECGVL
jgi:glucose-1-phosphatase